MTSLTVAMLADHWGCSDTFVYSQVSAGTLKSFKLGGKLIRIRQSDVEAYEQRAATVVDGPAPVAAMPAHESPPIDGTAIRLARLARARPGTP